MIQEYNLLDDLTTHKQQVRALLLKDKFIFEPKDEVCSCNAYLRYLNCCFPGDQHEEAIPSSSNHQDPPRLLLWA